ncbi:DUF917 domain-containing protein [Bacillota bacterium Lsc_1132]
MGWIITKKDIPEMSLGAKFLSCGGGGDTKTVEYLLLSIMTDSDMIVVKTIVDILNEWIVPVAIAGSTVLFNEDLPTGSEMGQTLQLYESITKKTADAVISIEMGGINGLIPLLVAIERGLPVIDGDGMGRAFPKLEMTSFFHSQVDRFPLVVLSGNNTLMVQNPQQFHEKFQSFLLNNDGYGHIAGYGMHGQQMKAAMIPGTLKLARDIGRVLSSGEVHRKLESLKILFSNSVYGNMEVVFMGRISSIHRWFESGVLVGTCHLDGQRSYHGEIADVYFQNEFLSMQVAREMRFTTPDLLIFVHYETGFPVSVSDIREGMVVFALTVSAPSVFYTKEMIGLTGPKGFDIPVAFNGGVPLYENWN